MALSFTGTLDVAHEARMGRNISGDALTGFDRFAMMGGDFTVAVPLIITHITCFSDPMEITTYPVGIYDTANGELLTWGKCVVNRDQQFVPAQPKPVLLIPGRTYSALFMISPGQTQAAGAGAFQYGGDGLINVNSSGRYTDSVDGEDPLEDQPLPNNDGGGWRCFFGFKILTQQTVTQSIPMEPSIDVDTKAFTISINRSFLPVGVVEWELQYARGTDGSLFDDWVTLAVLGVEDNTFEHEDLDPFDKPFYAYRYRVRTLNEESDWSEIAYTGQVSLAGDGEDINSNPDGSIDPSKLNVQELSAITANFGTMSAGTIRGPLIETSATNPRIVLQQGVGLISYRADGSVSFSLDPLTGNSFFDGVVTADAFQTGPVGVNPRLWMDSTGMFATNSGGTTILSFSTATGVLTVNGGLTTGSGSTINADYISTGTLDANRIAANSITAAKIAANTITAGQIAAGTITTTQIHATAGITGTQIAAATITGSNIVASAIDGFTITGATIRTSATNPRIELTSAGIKAFTTSGEITFAVDGATGKVITIAGIGGPNLLKNSSFEESTGITGNSMNTATTFWGNYYGFPTDSDVLYESVTTPQPVHGSKALRITRLSGTTHVGVFQAATLRQNITYTLSAWVMVPTSKPPVNIRVYADWTRDGVYEATSTLHSVTNSGVYKRISHTFTTPVGTILGDTMNVQCWINNALAGHQFYLDAMQLEEGSILTAYSPKPDEILPKTVGTTEITPGSVTGGTGGSLASSTVVASNIATNTLTANEIAASAITASEIAVGAVIAEKISFIPGGNNLLPNAKFEDWPTGAAAPADYLAYDNGGTGTRTWTRVPNGGPYGGNSWRVVGSSVSAVAGFRTADVKPFKANVCYTMSFWWKGDRYPVPAANGNWDLKNEWILKPVPSTTDWQRYAYRAKSSSGGPRTSTGSLPSSSPTLVHPSTLAFPASTVYPSSSLQGDGGGILPGSGVLPSATLIPGTPALGTAQAAGYDWVYVRPADINGNTVASMDCQICNWQWQEGEYPSAFAVTSYEVLPGTITGTEISNDAVTTPKLAANAVTADRIAANTITAANIAGNTITADKMSFAPAARNLVPDSGFYAVDALTRWNVDGVAAVRTATGGPLGNNPYAELTVSTAQPQCGIYHTAIEGVEGGKKFSVSVYAKSPVVPRQVFYSVLWKNAAGTSLGSTGVTLGTTSTTWQRFQADVLGGLTAPATAAQAEVSVMFKDVGGGNLTVAEVHYVANVQFQLGEMSTAWSQYINPVVVDGSIITAPTIRTSSINPKLQLDATNGLFLTDSSGNIVSQFKASGGGLDLLAGTTSTPPDERKIRWKNASGTTLVTQESTVFGSTNYGFSTSLGSVAVYEIRALQESPYKEANVHTQVGSSPDTGEVDIKCAGGGATSTKILLTQAGTSNWTLNPSDERLKTNIVPYKKDALSILDKLRPVTHRWKKDEGVEGTYLGLIAQEVKAILPEVIIPTPHKDFDDALGIDARSMDAFLISVIKGLVSRVDELENLIKKIK